MRDLNLYRPRRLVQGKRSTNHEEPLALTSFEIRGAFGGHNPEKTQFFQIPKTSINIVFSQHLY